MSVATANAAIATANAAANNLDITISHTLELFQQRLRRLEFLITGGITDDDDYDDDAIKHGNADNRSNDGSDSGNNNNQKGKSNKRQSVKQSLRAIDASLQSLSAKSVGVKHLLELHKKHPELLKPVAYDDENDNLGDGIANHTGDINTNTSTSQNQQSQLQSQHPNDNASPSPISNQLALVLSISQTYTHAASQLTLIQDLHVPPTGPLASLVALQPRLAQIQQIQQQQEADVMALAKRSGILLLRWYDGSVIGAGRCWVDWEARLREAEKVVRRAEVRREKEDGSEY